MTDYQHEFAERVSSDRRSEDAAHSHTDEHESPASGKGGSLSATEAPPRKKRKVNHACVYCRRSHMTCDSDRPCQRCIKRNIGHLCHDEPRESPQRKSKAGDADQTAPEEPTSPRNGFVPTANLPPNTLLDNGGANILSANHLEPRPLESDHVAVTNPNSGAMAQPSTLNGASQPQYNFNGQWLPQPNRFQDLQNFHPNYMFNANEVNDEYNLLNDFLSTSIFDETGMFSTDDMKAYSDPSLMNSMNVSLTGSNGDFLNNFQPGQAFHQHMPSLPGPATSRPGSVKPVLDKAREKYYMTAADPAGTDPPEERMNKLLKAKYDAGLLKPFNYVNGYARLNKYMEKNMKQSSRHKILTQLDRFRPKFRERMHALTDIELVLVEMWFERSLMEYDRVFASMAIPACCWRRTGEIFRGNREMAELIHVPIESLRDGKLAIHDFIVEDQLVSYWEKFCAICFDQQQKAMLTSCTLKSPTGGPDSPEINCCFSFTIRRDNYNIPSLIVGNFLPMNPVKT